MRRTIHVGQRAKQEDHGCCKETALQMKLAERRGLAADEYAGTFTRVVGLHNDDDEYCRCFRQPLGEANVIPSVDHTKRRVRYKNLWNRHEEGHK